MTTKSKYFLSKEAFLYMKMLANRCGINLENYRKEAIYNRLAKRLNQLNISDFDTYCNRLRIDMEEEIIFINLITNLTTQFFRENHHFEYLKNILLPDLLLKTNKIRIWSAGCSRGQEAYSIAMVLHETIPNIENYDVKILATDINSDALYTAEKGMYPINLIEEMTKVRQRTWFKPVENDKKFVTVNDELKSLIHFNKLNLIGFWPMHGPFNVIFCRNVIIYFNRETKSRILEKFYHLLDIGGVLILGHSEQLGELEPYFHSMGKTIFIKFR